MDDLRHEMDEFRHGMAGDGVPAAGNDDAVETFFVLAEVAGGVLRGRVLHPSITCGYLLAGARRPGREIAVVRARIEDIWPEESYLAGEPVCICSHCRLD